MRAGRAVVRADLLMEAEAPISKLACEAAAAPLKVKHLRHRETVRTCIYADVCLFADAG